MFAGDSKLGLASVNMDVKNGKDTTGQAQTSFFDRLDTAKKRSPTERIGAQIMIRLKYLLLSWFGLKPFLCSSISAYPSFLRPKGIPEIDYLTLLGVRLLWIFSCIVRNFKFVAFIFIKLRIMHVVNWMFIKLQERIARKMKQSNVNWEKRAIPVPEYDWKKGSPKEFNELFVKRRHPVVLRGFMKDENLLKEYGYDKMLQKFGEEDVMLTTREKDGFPGKMKEVENPKVYMHNSEVLFNKYPKIWDEMKSQKPEPYMKPMRCGHAQLFVGRKGTGTPFHSANTYNWFYMVDGSKRWYFLDPYDNYLANPMVHLGRGAFNFLPLYPDDYDESVLPAFKYCPYYWTDLKAGDCLLNPPWWGHAIRNTSEKSVAVATRWLTDGYVGSRWTNTEEDYDINRLASWLFFAGPPSWSFLHEILSEPSPKFDEHKTIREMKGRFTDFAIKAAKGEINIDGWRPIC